MATTFHVPLNNVQLIVSQARPAGQPAVSVVDATPLGSAAPVIVTAVRSGTVLAILEVTSRNGDVLTVSGAIEGTTDVALMPGDVLEPRPTALAITEIQAAVTALEARAAGAVLETGSYADPPWLASLAGAKVIGDIAGNSAGITGTLAGAQVVGDIAGRAAGITGTVPGSQIAGDISGNAASITGSIAEGQVTGLAADLAARAPLASPAFTGTPTAPTPATADDSTKLATTAYVQGQGFLSPSTTPTATNGQAVQSSSYAISADFTWQDTGLSVSIPSAGTYLLLYNVAATLQVGGSGGWIQVQLADGSGTAIANSQRLIVREQPGSNTVYTISGAFGVPLAAAGPMTVKLQAMRIAVDGTTTWSASSIESNGSAWSIFIYIRII